MMKRTISILLSFALCLTFAPMSVIAQETDHRYTQEQTNTVVQKYANNEDMFNAIFCTDVTVGYWGMINRIKQNRTLSWALDMSSILIGEYPEKQDYAEMLANLMTMQSGELAEQIETQSRFDDLKDVGDYAWDIVDIAGSFVDANGLLETISPIVNTTKDGTDLIISSIEQAKFYEVAIQDYLQNHSFLSAISMYAEKQELRTVAKTLISANKQLLTMRLDYLSNTLEMVAEFEAGFFMKNLSFELLKNTDLYATDENVKFFVDCSSDLNSAIGAFFSAGEFAFKMTMLAGDIGFGTSDVYNRYQEMRALADIAGALVKANENVSMPEENNQEKLKVIQEKCNLYKALIVTHARGEYLLYQMLMNDAGVLSNIRGIAECFKNPEDTTDAWYEGQVDVLTKYCSVLDNMFVVSSAKQSESVVQQNTINRLAKVNTYQKDVLQQTDVFSYDDKGMLIGDRITDQKNTWNYTFRYDDQGRVLVIDRDSHYSSGTAIKEEYIYQDSGRLLYHNRYHSYEYWEWQYCFEYDSKGMLEKVVLSPALIYQDLYGGTLSSEYPVNMVSVGNDCYVIEVKGDNITFYYTFGVDGRLLKETNNIDSTIIEYSYDYEPLVIRTEDNNYYNKPVCTLQINDVKGHNIWSIDIADGDLFVDKDGYLIGTSENTNGYRYEFIYEDVAVTEDYDIPDDTTKNDNQGASYVPDGTEGVVDAYMTTVVDDSIYHGQTFCFHIPKVQLNGINCDAINKKVYDDLYDKVNHSRYLHYTWTQKNGIISIVAETNAYDWEYPMYYVYNISAKSGGEISKAELLQAYGITEEAFYAKVRSALQIYWEGEKILINSFGKEFYDALVKRTLSDENIRTAVPYINSYGELCFVVCIEAPAGAGNYMHLMNEQGEFEKDLSKCYADH